jgi:hypothetical protein
VIASGQNDEPLDFFAASSLPAHAAAPDRLELLQHCQPAFDSTNLLYFRFASQSPAQPTLTGPDRSADWPEELCVPGQQGACTELWDLWAASAPQAGGPARVPDATGLLRAWASGRATLDLRCRALRQPEIAAGHAASSANMLLGAAAAAKRSTERLRRMWVYQRSGTCLFTGCSLPCSCLSAAVHDGRLWRTLWACQTWHI